MKRDFWPVAILSFMLASGVTACQSKTQRTLAPTISQDISKPYNTIDTGIGRRIKKMVDVTFYHPEKVVLQPDSFLAQLKQLPKRDSVKKHYVILLLNIGYVLREHGDILSSVRYYERAYNYYRKNKLSKPDFIQYIVKPLGNLYTRIDDIQKAVALQKKGIQMAKTLHPEYLPSLYNNLAIAYQSNGLNDSVIRICYRGLSVATPHSIYRPLLYVSLSNAFLKKELLDSAFFYNQKALNLFKKHLLKKNTLTWFASALKLKGDIEQKLKHPEQAYHYISRAITLLNNHFPKSKQRIKAKYFLARGQINLYRNPHQAILDFYQSKNILTKASDQPFVADYTFTEALHGLGQVYAKLNKTDSALFYYRQTIQNDYLTQELIVSKASNYKNSAWNRSILSEYLQVLERTYVQTKDSSKKQDLALRMFWAIELSKGRQVLREINISKNKAGEKKYVDKNQIRQKLVHLQQELSSKEGGQTKQRLKTKIADLELRLQLSKKYFDQAFKSIDYQRFKHFVLKNSQTKTLLSYLIQKDKESYIVFLKNGRCRRFLLSKENLKGLNIRKFVHHYFGNNPYHFENNPDKYKKRAGKIASTLLPFPIQTDKRIAISPDGILFKLPVEALINQGQYIVMNHDVSYTYSFLLNFLHGSKKEIKPAILFFGKQQFKGNFSNLKYVSLEKTAVLDDYKGKGYTGKAATVSVFLNQLNTHNIIHLATHTVSGANPYILFNKPLFLGSLTFVSMTTPLVVLSSCDGADGQLIKAEGLESLNKSFISKGASGVIASQWPVDDKSAANLMDLFYQKLYHLHHPAIALSAAKRSFIEKSGRVYQNPWYWASMNYMGVPTTIELQKKSSKWVWCLIIIAVLGLGSIVYYWRKKAKKSRLQREAG